MSITIRLAQEGDTSSIALLESACFSLPRLLPQIERERENFLVAVENNVFLGYADVTVILDEGYMGNIAVAPAHRKKGVGVALLRALLDRHRGALRFLTLEVRASNAPAIALYTKEGFQTAGIRKGMYEKPREDALLMTYFYCDN